MRYDGHNSLLTEGGRRPSDPAAELPPAAAEETTPNDGSRGSDRRGSRRFSAPSERREARLRSGDCDTAVQLLDESATGFAVLCDQHPGVFERETVWLQTVSGWETAIVVSIGADPAGVRIGLRRAAEKPRSGPKEAKAKKLAGPPRNRLRIVVGLTLVFTLIAVPLVRSSLLDPLRVATFFSGNAGSPDGAPLPERQLPQDASVEEVLRQLGPRVFSKAEVQRVLKISAHQANKLQAIVSNCNHAVNMAVLGGSSSETMLQLKKEQLKKESYKRAVDILTQEQRRVWMELVRHLQQREGGNLWRTEAHEAATERTAFD